jgi:hypothetical protein
MRVYIIGAYITDVRASLVSKDNIYIELDFINIDTTRTNTNLLFTLQQRYALLRLPGMCGCRSDPSVMLVAATEQLERRVASRTTRPFAVKDVPEGILVIHSLSTICFQAEYDI